MIMDWAVNIRRVSSSRVGLVVGKKPYPWATHPVADLALKVAGGWWTRYAQMPFGLQLLNASYFKLFYSWLACETSTSSVHRECFQFTGCDATLSHCALPTVLVSLVLPTRTPEAMTKLPIEDVLGNSCVIHTNDMSTPSELISDITNVAAVCHTKDEVESRMSQILTMYAGPVSQG